MFIFHPALNVTFIWMIGPHTSRRIEKSFQRAASCSICTCKKTLCTDVIPLTLSYLFVCHVDQNNLSNSYLNHIFCHSAHYLVLFEAEWWKLHRQEPPYDMASACFNLIHPLTDSDDISWLEGIHSECFVSSLTYRQFPTPIKCWDISLDLSCHLCIKCQVSVNK